MNELIGSAFPGAEARPLIAMDLLLKATIFLLLGYVVHALLGRGRALARSALWNATLVALVLLPVAGLSLPRVSLAVLPPRVPVQSATIDRREVLALPDQSEPAPTLVQVGPKATAELNPIASAPAAALPRAEPGQPRGIGIPALAAVIYLAVAALFAIRLVASVVAVHRLKRRCETVHDRAWTGSLARTQATLGISRSVVIVNSPAISIPMVIGWLSPVIVIPEALVQSASAKLIDMVLLHELAHVRRGDFAWNVVHKLVRIFYWPHPLFWPVGRIIGSVREQACDDVCVQAFGSGAAYRDSLLEVASGLVRRPELSLGLAMARATNLSRRLAWIEVSKGRARCLSSAPVQFGAALVVLALAGVLGAIIVERRSLSAEQEAAAAPTPEKTPAQPPVIEIVVRAKDTGRPLRGASTRFSIDFEFVSRKADIEGVVRFDLSKRMFQDWLSFDVWADGYVQQRYFFSQIDARYPKIPPRCSIELLPGEETLGGKVVDERGQPIAGVDVQVWGYLGEKKEPHEMAYMVDATTDAQGLWRCRCFRGMTFAYVFLSHPDYLSDGDSHPRRHGEPRPNKPPILESNQPLAMLRDFTDVQVMTAGVSLTGKVVDEHDKPVVGAEVGCVDRDGLDTFHRDLSLAKTDGGGIFRFQHVRPGQLVVQVKAKGHAPELKPLDEIDMAGHLTVKLKPPRSLAGRVVDSDGKPIPEVFVNVDTWRGFRSLGVFLKADSEGRFLWLDAPREKILINASRTGFASIFQRSVSAEEHAITLILKRSLAISGRVTDAATGKPVDEANVEIGVADPKSGKMMWVQEHSVFVSQGRLQGDIEVENRPELRLRVTAPGFEPAVSRIFQRDENQVDYDMKLKKPDQGSGLVLSGRVLRPDGKPLAGAAVTLAYPLNGNSTRLPSAQIENGALKRGTHAETVDTDRDGRFSVVRAPEPEGKYCALIVVHPEYYVELPSSAIAVTQTITAKRWGRIEGEILIRGKPAAGAAVRYFSDRMGNPDVPHVWASGKTKADDHGRFVFERVIPGDVRVSRDFGDGPDLKAWSNGSLVEVRPGQSAGAVIGAGGRTVVAKIVPPRGFESNANAVSHSDFEIESDRPSIPYPPELAAKHDGSLIPWAKSWWRSAEGHEYRRRWYRLGQAKLESDGTIRVDDVPPGDYRLKLRFASDPLRGTGVANERVAYATKQFTVPEMASGRTDEPVDLGVLRPQRKQSLAIGQAAPAFDVETLDGKRVKLEDFRGKFVLLDFWATWCGPCVAEIPTLKAVHDRFGKDERFVMVSLSLDAAKEAPRKFVAERAIGWKQGFLGEWSEGGVPGLYHVEAIPAIFLIGPDGKLLAKDIQGEAIEAAVANALRKP